MDARGDRLADDRVASGIIRRDGHCLTRLPVDRVSRIGDYAGDRRSGRELGLPTDLVNRHPIPGPGLAIRIPGDITREKLDLLHQVGAVYRRPVDRPATAQAIGP